MSLGKRCHEENCSGIGMSRREVSKQGGFNPKPSEDTLWRLGVTEKT